MTHLPSNQTIYFWGSANAQPDKMTHLSHQIQSCCELPTGWRFGEGRSATEEAAQNARMVLKYFHAAGTKDIEVFPEVEGGILVSGYHEQDMVDVLCRHNGSMSLVHEVADEEVTENPTLSMDDFVDYLGGLAWVTENLSESFIRESLAVQSGSSRVLPSRILQTGASPSSMWSVPETIVEQNASIYGIIILGLEEIHQSFGESFHLLSPKKAPLKLPPQTPEIHAIGT